MLFENRKCYRHTGVYTTDYQTNDDKMRLGSNQSLLNTPQGRRRLLKSSPALGRRKHSPSAEGTRGGEHKRGVSHSPLS